jgi:hypothetical protein
MSEADQLRATVEQFLSNAVQPAVLEPGEESLAVGPGEYAVEVHLGRVTLEAWTRQRHLLRRISAIGSVSPGRLELTVERFAKRSGKLFLLDLARPKGSETDKRARRLVFRERFRMLLRRQFPEWKLVELTSEANLESSLSPSYPRAFLRSGEHAWAAIAAAPGSDINGVLAFGLIWLSYLRARERRVVVQGLALYVPTGTQAVTAQRVLCLNPEAARFEVFVYGEGDDVVRADPADHGNLDTQLAPCKQAAPSGAWQALLEMPGVEPVPRPDGSMLLRVRGLTFAEWAEGEMRVGITRREAVGSDSLPRVQALVAEISRVRCAEAGDHRHPLYREAPEAWLESQVRGNLEAVDAELLRAPVYGQVPAMAGMNRGVLDLLAAGHDGRLAVVEIKATADLQLPLQALDYWLRVKWHLERGDFSAQRYFPQTAIRREAPRLLLVAPALEFHPTSELLLAYLRPEINILRIGLAVEWRKGLEVLFRLRGAERPQ